VRLAPVVYAALAGALVSAPGALCADDPSLKLRGPSEVQPYEPYKIRAVGHAAKDNSKVAIFGDRDGCAATLAAESADHHNRLLVKKTVDKGDFVVKTPAQAQELPGKVRYCGYLAKAGTTLVKRAKIVTVVQ
jgi:hypothetical protein